MATNWVKSLQCKSRAFDDVYDPKSNPKTHLLPSSSCRNGVQNIRDVIETSKHRHRKSDPAPNAKTRHVSGSGRVRSRPPENILPALTELPQGHPSRNVVEIIFHTSWSPKAFTGRVEMVFKVQQGSRTVNRFEEYRECVKSRAGSEMGSIRCVADGNEVMRFHCLGPTGGGGGGGIYDAGGLWSFHGGKGAAMCTYSGSGGAHESAGGGKGRRAMVVCRVIAGRVSNQIGFGSVLEDRVGFDSVCVDNGELLVFDSRAVLPCFLIIYRL